MVQLLRMFHGYFRPGKQRCLGVTMLFFCVDQVMDYVAPSSLGS